MQGLKNLGNTCSINTLIQCVGHCDHLRNWFLSEEPQRIKNKQDGKLYLSTEFSRIIHEMWNEQRSLAPVRFLKTLYSSMEGLIERGEQLDLIELWMLVAERINEDVGIQTNPPMIEGNSLDMNEFIASWKKHNERSMSMFLQLIQGWTTTLIKCDHCGTDTKLFEPFSTLGLDVKDSFQSMFDSMFKKERIQKRSCDHCKCLSSAIKSTSICMYPSVLVIYLKRFEMKEDGQMKKIKDEVNIPLNLRFNITDNESKKYRLVSIGNHVGNLQEGHYYSIAKNTEKWFLYDDINISEIENISNILKNNRHAYMLIYEAI